MPQSVRWVLLGRALGWQRAVLIGTGTVTLAVLLGGVATRLLAGLL